MSSRFEWLVAWRYLKDRDRPNWTWLFVGAAVLVTGAVLAWAGYGMPRPEPGAVIVTPAMQYGRIVFIFGAILALLGILIAVFGACLTLFRLFTTISIFGVFFGTMALIVVLSVMSGFEGNLRRSILGNNAHVVIRRGPKPFKNAPDLRRKLFDARGRSRVKGVLAATPFLKDEVILSGPKAHSGVYLKGIDPRSSLSRKLVGANIRIGTLSNLVHPERLRYLAPTTIPLTPVPSPDPSTPPRRPGSLDNPRRVAPTWPRTVDDPRREAPPRPTLAPEPDPTTTSPPPARPLTTIAQRPLTTIAQRPLTTIAQRPLTTIAPRPLTTIAQRPPTRPLLPPKIERFGAVEPTPEPSPATEILSPSEPRPHPTQPTTIHPRVLPGIIIGKELAKTLGLHLGDQVDVISTKTQDIIVSGPMPRLKAFRVAGIFFSGHYEYDQKYAYVTLGEAQGFLNKVGLISGIEIHTSSPDKAEAVAKRIRAALGPRSGYEVRPWQQIHKAIFSALELEKIIMFMVLVIIVLVASFSIVANLIMVVTEKSGEIAVLRSMGAKARNVLTIFLYEGLYIGMIGMIFGISVGIALSQLTRAYGLALDPEIYYIKSLPIAVDPWEVAVVAGAVILISLLAALFPAVSAMRKAPVQGLRYK